MTGISLCGIGSLAQTPSAPQDTTIPSCSRLGLLIERTKGFNHLVKRTGFLPPGAHRKSGASLPGES